MFALHGGLEYLPMLPTPTSTKTSTFFFPHLIPTYPPRILHLQGGVTLKTLPVLNYPYAFPNLLFILTLPHRLTRSYSYFFFFPSVPLSLQTRLAVSDARPRELNSPPSKSSFRSRWTQKIFFQKAKNKLIAWDFNDEWLWRIQSRNVKLPCVKLSLRFCNVEKVDGLLLFQFFLPVLLGFRSADVVNLNKVKLSKTGSKVKGYFM